MLINRTSGAKFASPLEFQANVSPELREYGAYIERSFNEERKVSNDTIAALLEVIQTLNVRINALEEWKFRESGELDVVEAKTDDPSFIGKTAIAITNVSMNSVRLSNLENEMSTMRQVLGDTIATTEQGLHAAAQQLNLLTDTTNTMVTQFKVVEKRVKNLESFVVGGIKDKLKDQTTSAVRGLIKGAAYILRGSTEWAPIIGQFVTAAGDLADGITFLIDGLYSLVQKGNSYDFLRAGGDNAKLLSKYLGDSSELRDLDSTDIVLTPITTCYLEIMNTLRFHSLNNNNDIIMMPYLNYYLRPIFNGEFLSPATKLLLDKFAGTDVFSFTHRIPVHGYVVVIYPMTIESNPEIPTDGALRRQFVMSVGAEDISITALLRKNSKSFVEYIDRVQRYSVLKREWQDVATIYNTRGARPSDFENDIRHCSLVEHYTVKYSYNFIRDFFQCMYEHEEPYDLLNHNCQTMSREVINFVVTGSLPHFWNPECSRKAALAEFTNKYQLPANVPGSPMRNMFKTDTNYLTNTGGNPNALDTFRNREATNKASWIAALS
jgi:hypothetical protein